MQDTAGNKVKEALTEDCLMCGGEVVPSRNDSASILCDSCAETADLPLSAYYLTQYYYRFSD